ncbi:unknown [Bacteroides sp. CAG:633]|nr:unknown [Bacteroides sp. CAG:633]
MGKYPSLLIGIFAYIRQCFAYFFHEAGSNSSVLPLHCMTLPYQNSLVKWNLMCLKSI